MKGYTVYQLIYEHPEEEEVLGVFLNESSAEFAANSSENRTRVEETEVIEWTERLNFERGMKKIK